VVVKMAKTITVKDETHARMRKLGRMDESFDDLINRMIEGYIAFYKGR
jgi:predicted CopG family antitoxin